MKICTFRESDRLIAGVVVDGTVVRAHRVLAPAHESELDALLDLDRAGRTEVDAAAREVVSAGEGEGTLAQLELGPPIPGPEKIICLGLNYHDHAKESGLDAPSAPMLFAKFRNSLIGDGAEIVPPRGEPNVDYEAEMAVVIGSKAHAVSEAEALSCVAGVMPLNDVSARTLQLQTSQWLAGKAIDTFAPCGPVLTTLDEVGDVQDLAVRCWVNDELVQDGTTAEMIFPVAKTIAFISNLMTLVPGDIIATGTPAGVGVSRDPKLLLEKGDQVKVQIGDLEPLENPVSGP